MRRPRGWYHHSRKKPSRSGGEEAAPHAGTHLLLSFGAAQPPIPLKPLFGRAVPSLECRCAQPPPPPTPELSTWAKGWRPALLPQEVSDSVSVAYRPTSPGRWIWRGTRRHTRLFLLWIFLLQSSGSFSGLATFLPDPPDLLRFREIIGKKKIGKFPLDSK